MDQPDVEQAQGYSFAPKYQPTDVKQLDQADVSLVSNLSSFAQKFINKRDSEDNTQFLKGIVDETAGKVQEASWLTPKSYTQGVAYKKLSDSTSATTARINEILQEEFEKPNPSFQSFNDALKNEMSVLNGALEESGLEGTALELAQRQLIQTSTVAQADFQKRLEIKAKRDKNSSMAQDVNTSYATLRATDANPAVYSTILGSLKQRLLNRASSDLTDDDPDSTASKMMADALKSDLSAINPANPTEQARVAALNQWIRSDEAIATLGSSYNDATDAMVKKQQEIMGYNGDAMDAQITEVERRASTNEYIPSRKEFQAMYSDVMAKVQSGVLKSSDGAKLYNKIFGVESKIYKDAEDNSIALSADVPSRMAKFGADHNTKQNDAWFKSVGSTIADDGQRGIAAIRFGVQAQNPILVRDGAKQFANTIGSMLLADPKKFDEVVTKSQKDTWRIMVNQYKELSGSNPAYAAAILDGLPEDQRSAFERMLLAGDTPIGRNVGADINQMRTIIDQDRQTKATGGFAGNFTRKQEFTADDFKNSLYSARLLPTISFGLLGDTNTTGAKNWWLQGNKESRERQATLMNKVLRTASPWLNAQEARGMLIQDKSSMIKALKDGGYFVGIESGVVPMNPAFKQAATQGFKAVGGVPMSDELFQRTLSAIQSDYYNKFQGKGGRDFDLEDVVVEADGNILKVYAYKNGAIQPYEVQKWGVSHVHERAWNITQADKKRAEANPLYVGEMVHGRRNLPISSDLANIFKGGTANDIVSSLYRFEGDTGLKVSTPDASRPNIKTIGPGIRIDGKFAQEPERAAIVNAKTKAEYDAAINKFMVKYYKDFPNLVQSAGLKPIEYANAGGGRTAYIALANAHYQSPGAGQEYAQLLTQAKTNPKAALEALKDSKVYKDINSASGGKADKNDRIRLYREGIQAAARAAGIDNFWVTQAKNAFTKPTYPLLTTPEGWKATPKPTDAEEASRKKRREAVSNEVGKAFTKPAYPLLTTPKGW